jgi:molecular chaperone GrpE
MIDDEKQPETQNFPPQVTDEMMNEAGSDGAEAKDESRSQPDPATTVSAEEASGEFEVNQEVATEDGKDSIDYSALVASLEQDIQLLKSQLDDRTNQYMRIAADFENFRRRTQKEKEELEQQIKCSTINEMLPVVDNFERARSQIKPQTDGEMNIHKSYQSVYKQLVDCLKRVGVAPMRSEGKEFDPTLHEAVMREATEEQPEGTVLEELVRGYMLGDRVLRHAMVKVAAAPDPVIPSEEGS